MDPGAGTVDRPQPRNQGVKGCGTVFCAAAVRAWTQDTG